MADNAIDRNVSERVNQWAQCDGVQSNPTTEQFNKP